MAKGYMREKFPKKMKKENDKDDIKKKESYKFIANRSKRKLTNY
jgi:hypothetical protein